MLKINDYVRENNTKRAKTKDIILLSSIHTSKTEKEILYIKFCSRKPFFREQCFRFKIPKKWRLYFLRILKLEKNVIYIHTTGDKFEPFGTPPMSRNRRPYPPRHSQSAK